MDNDHVILVDENDREIGTLDKLQAHREGRLHRAISVFVYNGKGELLLQRRASTKYHSGSLWSNTCCSHPRPGEDTGHAATRRLQEEMGITCPLVPAFSFIYRAAVGELEEHELDHVYVGTYDGTPIPNPIEVGAWKFASPEEIAASLKDCPETFTAWFKMAFEQTEAWRRRG